VQHKGVVVARLIGGLPIARRGQHAHCGCAENESVAFVALLHGNAQCGSLMQELFHRGTLGQHSDPQLAWAEVAQDRSHAGDVVGVTVGDGDGVEARETASPQVGGDDVFAEV
jgi:hypothetical protein